MRAISEKTPKNEFRPYQLEDIEFLSRLDRAGIFNAPRTGKTPTALGVLQRKNCKRILIITTKTSLDDWQREFHKWLGRPCIILNDKNKTKRLEKLKQWTDGAVISYDTLKNTKAHTGMIEEILKFKIDAVILDEAHKIKSRKSAITKAVFKLTHVPVRLALTGTLAPNKNHEIWSILHFLYPVHFRSYWKFINEYFKSYERYNSTGKTFIEIGGFKSKEKEKELQYILNGISVQRKREELMKWLPAKPEPIDIKLTPTKEQLRYIQELKDYYETGNIVTTGVLDTLIRIRQICAAPALLGLKGKSPKIEWLKTFLKDYPERPVLIFTKFTSLIHLIQKELPKPIPMITGNTSLKERSRLKSEFQSGKINQLIMNIDTCKEAITLDRAEYEIFLDKYPPAGDILQAEDRFIATTPERASKVSVIMNIILKDTYDEQLFELVKKRLSETDIINNFKKYLKEDV